MSGEAPKNWSAAAPNLRERVLKYLLAWLGAGTLITSAIIYVHAWQHGGLGRTLTIGVGALCCLPVLSLSQRWLGYRRCAGLLIAYLFLVVGYFQCFRGLTPGTVLGSVALLIVSGMFFDARAVVGAFALSLLSLLTSAALVLSGWVEPLQAWFWEPRDPLVWFRYAVIFVMFGGGLTNALVLLIRGLERAQNELAQTLERERLERSRREIMQRALDQAQRIEALSQFAAGMAHDFNNTLSVIVSGANVIRSSARVAPEILDVSTEIAARAQLGAESLRQLLSLARDDGGKPVYVSIRSVLHRSLGTLKQAVGPNVLVHLECDSNAVVSIDVGRFQQALLNLALNARDAMPDGGSWTLRVTERHVTEMPAGWATERGEFVCVECTDTGTGLDSALIDKIFEPFFTTKEPGKGTGLGLPMVRKTIVDAHGFIETSSRAGAGTSFKLHLPLVHHEIVSSAPPSAAESAPPIGRPLE